MKVIIKAVGSDFRIFWNLFKEDRARKNGIPLKQKIAAWRNGFLPDSFLMYTHKNNIKKHYLSDYYRYRYGPKINGHFDAVLNDKFLFNRVFEHSHLIKPVITHVNGQVRGIDEELINDPFCLKSKLGKGKFVIKPSFGGGGKGLRFIDINDSIEVDHIETDEEGLWEALVQYRISIIDKYIEQTGFAHDIYPHSVNTIRLLTMFDRTANKAFLAHATFRCGTARSGKVDNWTSGGLSIYINRDSGTLGQGAPFPRKGKLQWYSNHPETNVKFEGRVIPGWSTIVSDIIELADKHSYIPYIGWDIIPMENGNYLILEANSNSGVNFLQIHYPLLDDPRIKSFYNYYGKV